MSPILFSLTLRCACRVSSYTLCKSLSLGLQKDIRPALRMTDQCKNKLVSWCVGKRSHHDSCRHFASWCTSLAEIRNKSCPILLGLYVGCWLQGMVGTTSGPFQRDRSNTKVRKHDWTSCKFLKAATNTEVCELLVKKLVHGCSCKIIFSFMKGCSFLRTPCRRRAQTLWEHMRKLSLCSIWKLKWKINAKCN